MAAMHAQQSTVAGVGDSGESRSPARARGGAP
jgi:hypothetical protein